MGIGSSGVVNCANTYLGTANYTVADGYVADRTVIVDGNGPAQLNLNFARDEVLDPRITFSRTSNATRTNAQGLIEYAPHNLLTYSEQFDNAVWGVSGGVVAPNSTISPSGEITADTLTENVGSTDPRFAVNYSFAVGANYALSVYAKVKPGSSPRYLMLVFNSGYATPCGVNFDLSVGTVGTSSGATGYITQLADGWYRCSMVPTSNAIGGDSLRIRMAAVNTAGNITSPTPYTGDGTSGIYLWGAQLNIGSLQPYYTTSVKNLLGYSQNFENAAWAKSNSTIDTTPVMGPFGYLGAMKLVENTAASVPHGLAVDTSSLSSTTQYTFSVYAKAGERTWVRLGLVDNLGTDGGRAWFDLSNGVVGTVETNGAGSNINATINSTGGGWYRCRFTAQMNNGKTTLQSQVRLATANNVLSYTGDGTSGIYIFGAQLSDSASLDPYVYNFGAAPTSSAYYGPRFDYDPVTLAPKGLLIEEARTNLLTYSNEFDTAAWVRGVGLTVSVNTAVSPDGSQNADTITANGSAATASIYYDNITVTASTSYTFSIYVKLGTLSASDYKIAVYNVTGSAFIALDVTPTQVPNSTGWTRISYTFTTPVGCISARVYAYRNSATVTNATMYFYGAQLEAGAFPTSYIPTTSAQITRTADNASMVGTNFSSWYNQSEGTVSSSFDVNGVGSSTNYNGIVCLDDGSINNAIELSMWDASGDSLRWVGYVANTPQWAISPKTYSSGVSNGAGGYQINNFNAAFDGILGTTDNSGSIPTVNIMRIGTNRGGNSNYLNGHIKSFKYFSKRFINTYLQSLTQ